MSDAGNGSAGSGRAGDGRAGRRRAGGWSWWYLLFLLEFAVALYPPLYNKIEPTWIGIPFFYWFQLLWVIVSAVITAVVYFATDD